MRISPFARHYLRSRSEELMHGECIIYRPGGSRVVYDPNTREATNAAGTTVYEGVCRLWEVISGSNVILADDELVISQLWFSIPFDAPVPEPEDQVKIVTNDDASLIGRHLKILSIVRGGGLRGSRRMQVQFIDSKKVAW